MKKLAMRRWFAGGAGGVRRVSDEFLWDRRCTPEVGRACRLSIRRALIAP
jgi:hypothetical protein